MKKLIFILMAILLVSCSGNAVDVIGDVSGYYEGSIEIEGRALPLTLTLEVDEDLTGSIDIPVQNAYGLMIEEVEVSKESLKFTIKLGQSNGYFDGKMMDGVFTGDYVQNGLVFPFEFELSEKPSTAGITPFTYERDGFKITGELIVPEEEGTYPLAIIIAGSGMTDMNGNSNVGVFSDTYKYIANDLRDNGIASIRYNKRIIDNPIVEEELSFNHFVEDVIGIVESVEEDPRFSEIILIGHSQGALVAQLASQELDVNKVVLVAGAGRPIDEVLVDQIKDQVEVDVLESFKSVLEENKKGNIVNDVPESLNALIRPSVQPFLISWMQYDPVQIISEMNSDILIINGSTDIQVPVSDGDKLQSGNLSAKYIVIDNMTHVLKEASDDREENLKTYQDYNIPLHEAFVKALIDFIK